MNRQVGATTILATLLLLVGAVLLSSQWPTTEAGARALASPVYLVAEIALYLVFLVILDRGLSAAGYALGAFGALGIRLAIGFAAAAEEYFRGGGPYDAHLYPAIFSLPRVVLAVTTAVAILMLLRECLPQSGKTAAKAAKPKQAPKFAFEVEAASGLSDRRPSKVIIVDQTVGAAQRPTVAAAPEPERTFEGFVEQADPVGRGPGIHPGAHPAGPDRPPTCGGPGGADGRLAQGGVAGRRPGHLAGGRGDRSDAAPGRGGGGAAPGRAGPGADVAAGVAARTVRDRGGAILRRMRRDPGERRWLPSTMR